MSAKDAGWVWVKTSEIDLAPYNVNTMDEESRNSLMEDMNHRDGPYRINPIEIRPLAQKDRLPYEVVDGNQRLDVARRTLRWDRIRATTRKMDELEARVRNFRLNNERGHLDPIKQAEFFQQLQNRGLKLLPMAKKLGLKRQRIQQILRRLKVSFRSAEILERVPTPKQIEKKPHLTKWKLSAHHYEALGGIKDAKVQEELARITTEEGLAARQTKKLAQLVKQGLSPQEAVKLALHPGGRLESESSMVWACSKCRTVYTIEWEDKAIKPLKK